MGRRCSCEGAFGHHGSRAGHHWAPLEPVGASSDDQDRAARGRQQARQPRRCAGRVRHRPRWPRFELAVAGRRKPLRCSADAAALRAVELPEPRRTAGVGGDLERIQHDVRRLHAVLKGAADDGRRTLCVVVWRMDQQRLPG